MTPNDGTINKKRCASLRDVQLLMERQLLEDILAEQEEEPVEEKEEGE